MYNYSGIIHFIILAIIGLIFFVICLLVKKPWSKDFKLKDANNIAIVCLIVAGIYLLTLYTHGFIDPNISSYTGEFSRIDQYRPLRLPRYYFWNGQGEKLGFMLDRWAKEEVYPEPFIEGKTYKIYYEERTDIIVRVEEVE